MATPPKSPGRPKGAKNKLALDIRDRILAVEQKLEETGQTFLQWAAANETAFRVHFVKALIPKDLKIEIPGISDLATAMIEASKRTKKE